ncbi:MAG TPA: glycosyltransferase [Bacteroidales bacterium]|nr:glycosyltransferase [Bacteroidales bacterium]
MKILIAAPAWPYRGGIAEFSNRLATQFKAEGNTVRIETFSLQYPSFLFPGKTQYTDSPAPEGLEIKRSMNSVNPLNWIKLGLKIRREKPDILLLRFWLPFMGPCLGTISRIARGNKHTKVICIFDNVVPHEKRPGDRILTKYLVNSIDGAIVMAGSVGEDLKQFRTGIPVKMNPHPIFDTYGPVVTRQAALEFLRLSGEHRYILFFGFIRAYKGLDMLLEAMSYPIVKKTGYRLIVAGEFYEDDAPYRELIRKNGLEENVILFDHFIRDNEVPYFFCSADLVVQPYKSATQSGVTQIAFRYEKPMLVTDVGGLREILPDRKCGYVVQPDPNEISQAIADFFNNKKLEPFTECVRQEKGKFAWERMTESIIEVCNQTR